MRTNLLLKAWEAGFALCRVYGDNYIHFAGQQKERHWGKFLATIPTRDAGEIMERAKELVRTMNPTESRNLSSYVREWPAWARADWALAFHALNEAADGLPARHKAEPEPFIDPEELMRIHRAAPR